MNAEKCTREQLTKYNKAALVDLLLSQQKLLEEQAKQLAGLNHNIELLLEQNRISRQDQYGRSTEKLELPEQLSMCFNEAEVTIENKYVVEPVMEQVIPEHKRRIKQKGKREADLSDFPVRSQEHTLSEEQLAELFPNGCRRLPDEVYKKLEFHPATFEVVEHHIAVYCGNKDQRIIRADHPCEVLNNSIVTPSLLAAVLNTKYINSVPLYRLEQEFKRYDVNISRQVMANWVIRGSERYFSLLYDRMHQELYKSRVLHADETPVQVIRDGRESMTNSYMWVYRTGCVERVSPVVLYEYQKTRKADHPVEFLKDYKGVVVCDGYQVYHKIAKERPEEIRVAGCWAHARRPFARVCKSLGKEKMKGTLAESAVSQMAMIYHVDHELSDLEPGEKLRKRQLLVKPLVEAFFTWVKASQKTVPEKSETGKGLTYCLNQEKYLKAFLDDPLIPLDNNAAEIAIRGFCIGKHNWHIIDTIEGAQASAIVYSIAESAKLNGLKPYDYFKYLLEEIPRHMNDKSLSFLEQLVPWSKVLPQECYKKTPS